MIYIYIILDIILTIIFSVIVYSFIPEGLPERGWVFFLGLAILILTYLVGNSDGN